jgi:hypothetical protein
MSPFEKELNDENKDDEDYTLFAGISDSSIATVNAGTSSVAAAAAAYHQNLINEEEMDIQSEKENKTSQI